MQPSVYQRVKIFAGFGEIIDDSTTPFSLVSAATANATLVKPGAGVLVAVFATNQNAAIRYLKFYDLPPAGASYQPPTPGAGAPVRRYSIPGNAAGAGFILQPRMPMKFLNSIGFVIVAGTGLDTDVTAVAAADVIVTLEYI